MDEEFLEIFFGAYFHNDWGEDHSSSEAVLIDFAKLESVESVQRLHDALTGLLNDEGLDDGFAHRLGGALLPSVEGKSAAEWVTGALSILTVELKRRIMINDLDRHNNRQY